MIRSHYQFFISCLEVALLTGIFYYFWRIGYDHGIEGYPEYFGKGRFVLMIVYAALSWLLLRFSGSFQYKSLRTINLIVRQWSIILIVNLITYLQLSLTAKDMVARRPMFDASVVELFFIVIYLILTGILLRRIRSTEHMLAVGEGIPTGTVVDGYRVDYVYCEPINSITFHKAFEVIDRFDAVVIRGGQGLPAGLVEYCLKRKAPTYIATCDSLIYGVYKGKSEEGWQYVFVRGIGESGERFWDRLKAYLM